MKHIGIALAAILMTTALADASIQAGATTKSYLLINDTDNGALRTISQNSFFYMPGLCVKGYGEADMNVTSEDIGLMILDQTINFSTDNSGYHGMVTSHVRGRNLSELNVSMSAFTSTGIGRIEELNQVKSESSGLGIADPGIGRDIFILSGGHYLILNTTDMPLTYNKPLQPYEFSFEADDLTLDEPVDYLDQQVELTYSVSPDYEMSYMGYDFARTIEKSGITCQSKMQYGMVSG
jgi:hypothetical protein